MAKVEITIPKCFIFSTVIDVRIYDINYGGHLGHDSVFSLTHEARVRFLKEHNFSEKDVDGSGIILRDAAAVYKKEGFYGDPVKIQIAIGDITNYGCDLYYLLQNNNSGNEIARVKTGILFFDYSKRKVVRIPQKFLNILKKLSSKQNEASK